MIAKPWLRPYVCHVISFLLCIRYHREPNYRGPTSQTRIRGWGSRTPHPAQLWMCPYVGPVISYVCCACHITGSPLPRSDHPSQALGARDPGPRIPHSVVLLALGSHSPNPASACPRRAGVPRGPPGCMPEPPKYDPSVQGSLRTGTSRGGAPSAAAPGVSEGSQWSVVAMGFLIVTISE